jgi:hypothetical protein
MSLAKRLTEEQIEKLQERHPTLDLVAFEKWRQFIPMQLVRINHSTLLNQNERSMSYSKTG